MLKNKEELRRVLSLTENLRINKEKREEFETHCILRRCNIYQVLTEGKQIYELEIKIWESIT